MRFRVTTAGASTIALAIALCLSSGASGGKSSPAKHHIGATTYRPAVIAAGRTQFLQTCAGCHGADAAGGDGPDLRGRNLSVSTIAFDIGHGFKGEMPPFTILKPDQVSEVAAYIGSLKAIN